MSFVSQSQLCTVASWPMRVLYFCSTHFMSSPLWSPCLINFIKASRNGTDHYSFPQPIRILFICCIDFTLILILCKCVTADQQSALSIIFGLGKSSQISCSLSWFCGSILNIEERCAICSELTRYGPKTMDVNSHQFNCFKIHHILLV